MPSPPPDPRLADAAQQTQFLNVITRDEATRRFHQHLRLAPLGKESVPLAAARGRVLAEDVVSPVDVPAFDRSNVDGFALQAADTTGAMEESPRTVRLNSEVLSPGIVPREPVMPGTATTIATGGMLPRGADCVVMVEHTELVGAVAAALAPSRVGEIPAGTWGSSDARILANSATPALQITRAAAPGQFVTFAGTDVARGETVLWTGQVLTSREIGVLAAIGRDTVDVFRKPRVAIISTGDEIVAPGRPLRPGAVYDSNAAIVAATVEELGGEPIVCGAIPDDEAQLQRAVDAALQHDVVILSGGTSKGAGDLSYRVVSRLTDPGIVAHGVALKPGKPICLAVTQGKPVVVLPGFPTSAIFTFHEFVAPVLRALAGFPPEQRDTVAAVLPHRVHSDRGRTEYLLVSLVRGTDVGGQKAEVGDQPRTTDHGPLTSDASPLSTLHSPLSLVAYPIGKGSGSVTTFSLADGFITIDQHTEIVEAGTPVSVTLLDPHLRVADLVVIGSHCVGLDYVLSLLRREGLSIKTMHVGSTAGLAAAKRGECDIAGMHLLDPVTGEYNRPFVTDDLELLPGYRRRQCLVFRPGDPRFSGKSLDAALAAALADPGCTMVNRNAGSGTRIVIDELLERAAAVGRISNPSESKSQVDAARERTDWKSVLRAAPPPGYGVQAKSHNAVAAAVAQGRADWGVAIDTVAREYGLEATPVRDEHYDFVIPRSRRGRAAVERFVALINEAAVRERLAGMGFGQ